MAVATAGQRKFIAFGAIAVLDIAVLALSISVNIFQGFFFVADIFSLLLSIFTLVLLLASVVLELTSQNAFTARPAFEVPLLAVLAIFWLGLNAFSTRQWSSIPMSCTFVPDEYNDVQGWCTNMQALRVMVWIVWACLVALTSCIFYFAISEARNGNPHVWKTALSRYTKDNLSPISPTAEVSSFYRASSLFNFPIRRSAPDSASSRDFFAPPSPVRLRNSVSSSIFGGGYAGGVGAFASPSFNQTSPSPSPGYSAGFHSDGFKGFEIVTHGTLAGEDLWTAQNKR